MNQDCGTKFDRRKNQIVEMLAPRELSGWEVALKLYGPREHLFEKRQALQEALAHLQALAVEDRIEKVAGAAAVRWRRSG